MLSLGLTQPALRHKKTLSSLASVWTHSLLDRKEPLRCCGFKNRVWNRRWPWVEFLKIQPPGITLLNQKGEGNRREETQCLYELWCSGFIFFWWHLEESNPSIKPRSENAPVRTQLQEMRRERRAVWSACSWHLENPIPLTGEIRKGKRPHVRCFPLGNTTRARGRVCRQSPNFPALVSQKQPGSWGRGTLSGYYFSRGFSVLILSGNDFEEKTSYRTTPHQCPKAYHTQTVNNDFKKRLGTSSFLDAAHTIVIIQIACDLWVYLATTIVPTVVWN